MLTQRLTVKFTLPQLIKSGLLLAALILTSFSSMTANAQDIYSKEEIEGALATSDAESQSQALRGTLLTNVNEALDSEPAMLPEEYFDRFLENPDNFFSGPKVTDIGFILTEKLVGTPANYALSKLNDEVPGPQNVDDNITAFSYLLRVASYLGTVLTSVLIGYLFVGGGLNTGRDGDFLGKDWDSFYAPIRALIGVIGTWPNAAFGGLSFSQLLILMAFLMGLGIGSATLTALAPVLMSKPLVSASFDQGKIEDMARAVGSMHICGMVQAKTIGQDAIDEFRQNPYKIKIDGNAGPTEDFTVTVHSNIPDWRTCGYITKDIYFVDESAGSIDRGLFSIDGLESFLNVGSGLTNDGYIKAQLQNNISASVMLEAVPKLIEDLAPIAAFASHPNHFPNVYQAAQNGEGTSLEEWGMQYWYAIDAFQHRVNGYVTEASQSEMMLEINREFTQFVEQHGMMLGGAYHNLIAKRQNAIAQAVEDSMPEYKSINLNRLRSSPWYRDIWKKVSAWVNGLWTDADYESEPMTEAISAFDAVIKSVFTTNPDISQSLMRQKELVSADTAVGNLTSYFSMNVSEWITSAARFGENTSRHNPDPILEMHSLGVKIQQVLMSGYAIKHFNEEDEEIDGDGTASDGENSQWAEIVFASVLGSLLLITFLYTVVIPGLPIIMFTVSGLGLFLFLIKALVAAPFWWAMHSHPVGNDLFGKAGAGYPLVLTLFLSPFLMIAGLIGAMALTRLSGWFVNITLMPSINIMNNGFTAPTNWVSYYVLYGIIMLVLVYKNYGLMYELRQVVLKWMGVDSAYTDFGEKDAQLKAVGLGAYAGTVIEKGQASFNSSGRE